MDIKPIRTEKDHRWALREIERIWDKAQPGTLEGDRFEVLSALVDAYEREHVQIPAPDPIETSRFRMDQEGLTNNDLLPIFKTRARVSEVMSRRRRLNLTMIRRLHERLDIPIECLVKDYKLKRRAAAGEVHRPVKRRYADPKCLGHLLEGLGRRLEEHEPFKVNASPRSPKRSIVATLVPFSSAMSAGASYARPSNRASAHWALGSVGAFACPRHPDFQRARQDSNLRPSA